MRLLDPSALASRELAAWRQLADEAVEPNPFHDPDFVLPAAAALTGPAPRVAVLEEDGRWLAALPVVRPRRWRRLPVPALATWRHPFCLLGTPLVAREGGLHALPAFGEGLRRAAGLGVLALEWLHGGGPVAARLRETLAARSAVHEVERYERAVAERQDAAATAGRRSGRSAMRDARRLAAALEAPVEELQSADPAAVERFLVLEASGWKGARRTAMASNPAHAEFFRRSCEGFAARGRLQMLELRAGDRTAAMQCNLLAGEGLFGYKVAMDDTLRRFAPGIQLERGWPARLDGMPGTQWVDGCSAPDNQALNRLWSGRRVIVTFVTAGARPGSRALAQAVRVPLALNERRKARAAADRRR